MERNMRTISEVLCLEYLTSHWCLRSSLLWAWQCPWRCVQGQSRPCWPDCYPWGWPCPPARGREGRRCSRRSASPPPFSHYTPPSAGRSPRWRSPPGAPSPGSSPRCRCRGWCCSKAPGQRRGRDQDWELPPLLRGRAGSLTLHPTFEPTWHFHSSNSSKQRTLHLANFQWVCRPSWRSSVGSPAWQEKVNLRETLDLWKLCQRESPPTGLQCWDQLALMECQGTWAVASWRWEQVSSLVGSSKEVSSLVDLSMKGGW